MSENWNGKRVLITGVCGTIGQEVLRQVTNFPCEEVIGIDNNESELFFCTEKYSQDSNVSFVLLDIKDYRELVKYFEGVDIVIHAAAFKHVHLCEQAPASAIETNIRGTQNVIDASLKSHVDRVVFTSSDKAVNPTNVMGTTKLMGERLITAANVQKNNKTIFLSTRFGNVLGSRGSVIPLFRSQIEKGGPLTLTDNDMTRFVMSAHEAVKLITDSIFQAKGGEVFVTKMPAIRVVDLAKVMIQELSKQYGYSEQSILIQTIGVKPGEKMYEELLNHEEVRRTIELKNYFVIKPAFYDLFRNIDYSSYENIRSECVTAPYNSSNQAPLEEKHLKEYLLKNSLI